MTAEFGRGRREDAAVRSAPGEPRPAGAFVVGVDAGGTSTRAVVADLDGTVVGRGAGGPGNPVAAGRDAPLAVAAALRQALAGIDPRRVASGVVSLAGASRLADPAVAGAFADVWAASGSDCPMWTVGDAVAAFAAGTPEPSGAVLISGTGAVAARIETWTIAGIADGLGWLLGDEGSGFWIGLRAVRTAARSWASSRAWSSSRPSSRPALVDLVARHAGVTDADQLVAWATALPRAAIAGLAPAVCEAARHGDRDATAIVTEAVARLIGTLDALAPPTDQPVVLAGGVLGNDNPVRDGVLRALRSRSSTVELAAEPVLGAAWLAARDLPGVDPLLLHTTLCGPDEPARRG